MTTQMSLKTVPDDNLALSVGFCVQTIVIHCLDICFYSLATLTVLLKIEEGLGDGLFGVFLGFGGFFLGLGFGGGVVVSVVVS